MAGQAWRTRAAVGVVTLAVAASACGGSPDPSTDPSPGPGTPAAPAPSSPASTPAPTPTTTAGPDQTTSPEASFPAAPDLPAATAEPQDVVTGLATPWDIAFLPTGAALITLRDAGQVVLLSRAGTATLTGPGAEQLAARTDPQGEGGLLGVAVSPDVAEDHFVYLYRTTPDGNEVLRAELDADAGTLAGLDLVLGNIPSSRIHNGGRIAFGPDGHLYVATGDANDRSAAQDPDALNGKILRITADGEVPPDNPTPGSPVWSLGHRNVQGLGWDETGRMFAGEFGQNTFDELNVIVPGGNYGWPQVEGRGGVEGFIDPVAVWDPSVASPSGIAVLEDRVFLAALRGERLLTTTVDQDGVVAEGEALVGELARLREVTVGPDGALWVLTQNTDGRGNPRPGDDRIVRLTPP